MDRDWIRDLGTATRHALLCYAWAWLFWYVILVRISYGMLGIGLGLAGALYPLFFTVPVLLGALAYLLFVERVVGLPRRGKGARFVWRLAIPFALIAVGLAFFTPIDGHGTYLENLFQRVAAD